MKLATLLVPLTLAATAASALAQPAGRPMPPRPYEVADVRAYLYFHGDDSVGDKDLTTGSVALWNTIIGEGDARAPSSAVVIKIDLTGPRFTSAPGKLVVEAKASGKRLARQTFAVSDYFHENGNKVTVPLVLTGVGCDEVTVTATLSGKGIKSQRTETIPFACGE